MLTIRHPELVRFLATFPGGLLPIAVGSEKKLSLVIKTSKDAIMAAKLNGGLSFYLPLIPTSSTVVTTSLICAFFDDMDEPIIIRTPLFGDDPITYQFLEILKANTVDIYFFDEHNHEWMSYRTKLLDGGSCLATKNDVRLLAANIESVAGTTPLCPKNFSCLIDKRRSSVETPWQGQEIEIWAKKHFGVKLF